MPAKRPRISDRATAMLSVSDTERINHIRKDFWLGHAGAKKILSELERLLTYPRMRTMPHVIIVGERGFGKRTVMHRFYQKNPPLKTNKDGKTHFSQIPVLLIESPAKPEEQRLYYRILEAINCLPNASVGAAELESRTYTLLKSVNIKILMIKNADDIIAGDRQVFKEMRKVLVKLSEEVQTSLVLSGTVEAKLHLDSDPRTENLFKPLYLMKWKLVNSEDDPGAKEPPTEFIRFLKSYEHILPLKNTSNLANPETAKSILEATEGILGEVISLIKSAAELAITTGTECIDQDVLKKLDYKSPTERKRMSKEIAMGLGLT